MTTRSHTRDSNRVARYGNNFSHITYENRVARDEIRVSRESGNF